MAKHSAADSARIALKINGGSIDLAVEDNGSGFDAENTRVEGRENAGVGLSGMRERAKLSGGSFSLQSGEEGTLIRASWPAGNQM